MWQESLGVSEARSISKAAVSPCQVQAIELQLVAWQESVRRQRTSLLAWLVVYSLYIKSITCWLGSGFSFSVCHLMAVALLRVALLFLSQLFWFWVLGVWFICLFYFILANFIHTFWLLSFLFCTYPSPPCLHWYLLIPCSRNGDSHSSNVAVLQFNFVCRILQQHKC